MGIRFHLPLPGPFAYTPDRKPRKEAQNLYVQRYRAVLERLDVARLAVERAQTERSAEVMIRKVEELEAEADRLYRLTPQGRADARVEKDANRAAMIAEAEAEHGGRFKDPAHATAYLYGARKRDELLRKAEEADAMDDGRTARRARATAARVEAKMSKHAPK
jgi:hypothetical protein